NRLTSFLQLLPILHANDVRIPRLPPRQVRSFYPGSPVCIRKCRQPGSKSIRLSPSHQTSEMSHPLVWYYHSGQLIVGQASLPLLVCIPCQLVPLPYSSLTTMVHN